jgi:16S rRNA (cytidine1402-2'-O)-methyltransferase
MSILYIIATPIGNLQDISARAIDTLRSVDLILCEDTRVTKKLLDHYQIKTPTLSYHQHSSFQKVNHIINLFKESKRLALVSDAGTPGISDPGNKLIHKLLEFAGDGFSQIKIVPIPGPSALITAASVSGFSVDRFIFMGFPPVKKKRKQFFEGVFNSKYPVIFYESPHRIVRTLNELKIMNKELRVVVCRELSKKFETIYRGMIEEVIKQIEKDIIRGEFVVIIDKK